MRRAVTITLGLLLVIALPTGTAIGFSRILDGSIVPRVGAPDGDPEAVPTTPTPVLPSPAVPEPEPEPESEPEPEPSPALPSSPPSAPEPEPEPEPELNPVTEAQRTLTDLGYYVDTVDGLAGPATRSALMAFQKVHDLPRTGELDAGTLAALQNPRAPQLRGTDPDRIEVDLTRQVLYVVEDGTVVRILPVSSGNGEGYTSSSGSWAYANTPTGTFTVTRKILGERHAALGVLYNPLYFHRGFAVHGSPSVPATEASHGCIRVTIADSLWLHPRVAVGTTVMIYGGTHVFAVS